MRGFLRRGSSRHRARRVLRDFVHLSDAGAPSWWPSGCCPPSSEPSPRQGSTRAWGREEPHCMTMHARVCWLDDIGRHRRGLGVHRRRAAAPVRRPPRARRARGHRRHPGRQPASPTSTRAWPAPTATSPSRPTTPTPCDGLDLVFLGPAPRRLPGVVPELAGRVGARRRPGRRLPAEGPRAVPAVVRRGAHRTPSCSADFVYGLPELFRDEHRAAPTCVAAPGCYVTAAALALAPLLRAGPGRADRHRRRRRQRGVGRRPAAQADHHVLHRRRGLHRLRAARPPPHARDRAGHSARVRCCSRRTWPR